MAEEVAVDPEQLRRAAKQAALVQERIDGTLRKLQASLAAAGPAWGNDSFGDKFANGEKGYLAARDNLTKGTETMAKTFGDVSSGQEQAADHLSGQEADNITGFGRRRAPRTIA
ncbi:WXG100 family type VII secretion target [Nocardia brasiliensis]|uniref:WXG100 family type VII secretion target n=1 Tax=Nocardia brasiliensis TaxID=37326 RepID=UPI0036725C19